MQAVFVLHYEHRHGRDTSVYATLESARHARASLVIGNLFEVSDDVAAAIRRSYEAKAYADCYQLYRDAVDDESMEIEERALLGARVAERFIVVDVETELTHVVATWPYATEHGHTLCLKDFCWWREGIDEYSCCSAYLPKETRLVTCLECLAAETSP